MTALATAIGRGTLAARPAAGSPGRVYFVTDGTATLYRDNGSSWDSIEGAGGGGGAPLGAQYVVGAAHADLTAEVVIPSLVAAHPDVPPASPATQNDEFDGSSLDAKWTNVSSAGVTVGGSVLQVAMVNAAANEFRQAFTPAAATAFTITAKFVGCQFMENTDYFGLIVMDAANANIANCDVRYTSGMLFNKDAPGAAQTVAFRGNPAEFYIRLARSAADVYTFSVSFDGRKYTTLGLGTGTSATTVAKLGLRFGQTASPTWTKHGGCDWVRVT